MVDQDSQAPPDHGFDQYAAPDMDRQEREALGKIVHAMRHYRDDAEWEVARWEYNYAR